MEASQIEPIFSTEIAGSVFATGSTVANTEPAAYLNYIFFDRDFNFVSSKSGFVKVAANNSGVLHQLAHTINVDEAFDYLILFDITVCAIKMVVTIVAA